MPPFWSPNIFHWFTVIHHWPTPWRINYHLFKYQQSMWDQTYSFKFTNSVPLRYFPLQRKKQKVRRKQETSFKSIWTKVLQPQESPRFFRWRTTTKEGLHKVSRAKEEVTSSNIYLDFKHSSLSDQKIVLNICYFEKWTYWS